VTAQATKLALRPHDVTMLRVYNSMTRTKEQFIPTRPGEVSVYSCGPTVYDEPHIGNWRSFVIFDVFRRYLKHKGFKVTFVQNITDIDDKIIKRANETGVHPTTLADKFTAIYLEQARLLGNEPADVHPRATEHVGNIIELIQCLIDKGFAYAAGGDVYFDTSRFQTYGALSGQPIEELEAGARVEIGEMKKSPLDFALWKARKPGEIYWDSPWGPGRPGWHIECSAMSMKYLGDTIDIHTGGVDLKFPHHENERAQSEAVTGKQFVKYWLHVGFLQIGGERMGKSLGNFLTLSQLMKKYDPMAIRFYLISAHYRSPLNYSEELLQSSAAGLKRLQNTVSMLSHAVAAASPGQDAAWEALLREFKSRFYEAMDDDFNTADAIAVLFDIARAANTHSGEMKREMAQETLSLLEELGEVLGLRFLDGKAASGDAALVEGLLRILLDLREEARKVKDWKTADHIRDALSSLGITIEDTPLGPRYRR